jgi:hypothetical protein
MFEALEIPIKICLMAILALGALMVYWKAFGKPNEIRILKYAILTSLGLRFLFCVALNTIRPNPADYRSDVAVYYFPDTLKILNGEIPYRDFDTRYSILFLPMLAIFVSLWRSMPSIVLAIILFYLSMIYLCFLLFHNKDRYSCMRVIFFYLLSPIIFYWIAIVGYNSVNIAFFVTLSLFFAYEKRDILSGLSAVGAFLFCKFLALLAWPALVFYKKRGWIRRFFPIGLIIGVMVFLYIAGIDILMPLKKEFGNYTSGNVCLIGSILFPCFKDSNFFVFLPFPLFALSLFCVFYCFIKSQNENNQANFDKSVVFIVSTFLLFMIFSRKTFQMYHPMFFLFVVHLVVTRFPRDLLKLLFLAFLGSVSYLEVRFFLHEDFEYSLSNPFALTVFCIDIIIIGGYIYLLATFLAIFRLNRGINFIKRPILYQRLV